MRALIAGVNEAEILLVVDDVDEWREVREQLFIMQELSQASKKYEDSTFNAGIEKTFMDYRMSFVDKSAMQMPGGNR